MAQQLNTVSDTFSSQHAIFIFDLAPPHKILEFNKSFRNLTGYSTTDLSNSMNTLSSIIYPEDFSRLMDSINYQLSISNLTNNQHRLVKKNGDIVSVLCKGQIYTLADGRNILQCSYTNITNLENAVLENKQARSDLASFAKSVPSGLSKHLCDSNLSVIWANEYFYSITGYTQKEWKTSLKNNLFSVIYKEDLPQVVSATADLIELGEYQITFRVVCKDNTIKWLNAIGARSDEILDNFQVINLVLSDITALKYSQMKAELEEKKYQIISEISEEIPYEYDLESDIITYAQKYSYTFGRKPIIKHPKEKLVKLGVISADTIPAFEGIFEAARRGDTMNAAEYKLQTKDGSFEWFYSTFSAIKDSQGKTTRVVGVLRNIHAQKQEQLRLLNKSQRDAMTGLYNKTTTESKVQDHLKTISSNSSGIVMLIDIDDFKNINDSFGHLIGDEVILDISSALTNHTSQTDIVGRVGGDEFLVYLSDVLDLRLALEKAENIANDLRKKYPGDDGRCKVTLSIGIAVADKPIPYTTFIENADTALYDAKLKGKDGYSIFTKDSERGIYHNDRSVTKESNVNNEIVMDVFDILYSFSNIIEGIEHAISYIGNNFNIDRICIWEYEFDRSYLRRTHQWQKDVNATYETLSDRPASRLFEEIDAMSNIGVFHSKSPSSITIHANYKSIVSSLSEFLQVTIYQGSTPIGYVGFLDYYSDNYWSDSDIDLYILFSKTIAEYVRKKKGLYQLDNLYDDTVNLFSSMDHPVYVVNRDNYELLYFNEASKEFSSKTSIGQKCYYSICGLNQPCKNCPLVQLSNTHSYATSPVVIASQNCTLDITASTISWKNHPNACILYSKPHKKTVAEELSENLSQTGILSSFSKFDVSTDQITGYDSFETFNTKVSQILSDTPTIDYALYYVNVKNFKLINETFGHSIGDKTLIEISNVLNKYLKEDEAFARVISDTFVMFKRHTSIPQQSSTFNSITDEIKRNCTFIQNKYFIDFSAGIIIIDKENRDLSVSKLIDRAIIAIKNTPDKQGTHYTYYEDNLRKAYLYQASLENNMYNALADGEFLPYLQPKFNITNNKIIGSEALVRWQSPINGFMGPDSFIPIFEKNGFIAEIDLYMLEQVCKTFREYLMNNYPIYPCSVNLSRVTLNHPDLILRIKCIVEEYRIPTEYIEFEITENVFVSDHNAIINTLNELKSLGFVISMDDFGSGYSSLILLKDLPIDVLKLDRQFLDADTTNPNTYHIMKSIIDMSKLLNIKVVCEGVETETQAAFLKDIGCEVGQGYLFAKPMPISDFNTMLRNDIRNK